MSLYNYMLNTFLNAKNYTLIIVNLNIGISVSTLTHLSLNLFTVMNKITYLCFGFQIDAILATV